MLRLVLALIGAVLGATLGAQVHPLLALVLLVAGLYFGARLGSRPSQSSAPVGPTSDSYTAESPSPARLGAYRGLYRDLEIVGESYRQPAIKKLWRQGGATRTFEAQLVPESNNPHDRNAVRVEVDGIQVAYLSRDSAKEYRDRMGADHCHIPVHLVQGGSQGTIGVFTGRSAADNDALRGKRTA